MRPWKLASPIHRGCFGCHRVLPDGWDSPGCVATGVKEMELPVGQDFLMRGPLHRPWGLLTAFLCVCVFNSLCMHYSALFWNFWILHQKLSKWAHKGVLELCGSSSNREGGIHLSACTVTEGWNSQPENDRNDSHGSAFRQRSEGTLETYFLKASKLPSLEDRKWHLWGCWGNGGIALCPEMPLSASRNAILPQEDGHLSFQKANCHCYAELFQEKLSTSDFRTMTLTTPPV